MASLTDVVSSYRKSGSGVLGSLSGGIKEKLKEKMDPRRFINQKGILPALFPGLKAFKASGPTKEDLTSGGSLSVASPYFDVIATNTKVAAKNSMALPLMHKDLNVMRQNMTKLVSLTKQRIKNDKKGKVKTLPSPTKTNTKTTVVKSEEEGGGLLGLLATLAGSLMNIGSGIASIVKETLGGLASTIINGLKGLFSIGRLATSLIGSFMGPLLSFLVSPVGLALVFSAAAIALISSLVAKLDTLNLADRKSKTFKTLDTLQKAAGGEGLKPEFQKNEVERVESEGKGSSSAKEAFKKRWQQRMELGGEYSPELAEALKRVHGIEVPKEQIKNSPSKVEDNKDTVAIGDNLANSYMSTNKVDGISKDGASPSQVLNMIKEYAKTHNLSGKTVMLSTGASNNPNEVDTIVPQQIEALKSSGANPVLLNTAMPEVNNKLQKIAESNKVAFDNKLTPAPIPTPVPTPKESGSKVKSYSEELRVNQKKEPSQTVIENTNIQKNDQSKAIPKTSIPSTWDAELIGKKIRNGVMELLY